jgi:hypothetical protein
MPLTRKRPRPFHWFDPSAAIPEVARASSPRRARDHPCALVGDRAAASESALELLSEPWLRFSAQRNPPWDGAFDVTPFEPLRYERFEDAIDVSPDALLELYSTSSIAALPHESGELIARVRPLLDRDYRLPIKHELAWTRLAG